MNDRAPNPRQETEAIGLALVRIAAAKAPLDVPQLGDLLKRLASVYSRGVHARDAAQRRKRA